MIRPKAVVLLSGGLDSTTLLAHLQFLDYEVLPLSIYYGQRHQRELDSVESVLLHYNLRGQAVDICGDGSPTLFRNSSQTDSLVDVPHGHYADESMKVTVVPNRNMILLSLAAAYAISNNADGVAYAAHAGDHAIYPDCRPQFANIMRQALDKCHFTSISLITPFITKSKADIVTHGSTLQVPFHLTWSCYDPQYVGSNRYNHCGQCGTCVERREAFTLASVSDPTEYAV